MHIQWKTTSDPFLNDFRVLGRQVDEVLREVFRTPTPRSVAPRPRGIHISETEETFTVRAALPGVRAEDLELETKDDTLTLRAKRSIDAPEGYAVHRAERSALDFERTLSFKSRFEPDKIEASFTHGVLTITLPKVPESSPRAITVRAA